MFRSKRHRAQVSLELGTAFVLLFLLLFGSVNLARWLVARMAYRQQSYEGSRASATSDHLGMEVDETNYRPLSFFGQ